MFLVLKFSSLLLGMRSACSSESDLSSSDGRPEVYYLRYSSNFETRLSESVDYNRLTSKEAKFFQLYTFLAEAGLELGLEK